MRPFQLTINAYSPGRDSDHDGASFGGKSVGKAGLELVITNAVQEQQETTAASQDDSFANLEESTARGARGVCAWFSAGGSVASRIDAQQHRSNAQRIQSRVNPPRIEIQQCQSSLNCPYYKAGITKLVRQNADPPSMCSIHSDHQRAQTQN